MTVRSSLSAADWTSSMVLSEIPRVGVLMTRSSETASLGLETIRRYATALRTSSRWKNAVPRTRW